MTPEKKPEGSNLENKYTFTDEEMGSYLAEMQTLIDSLLNSYDPEKAERLDALFPEIWKDVNTRKRFIHHKDTNGATQEELDSAELVVDEVQNFTEKNREKMIQIAKGITEDTAEDDKTLETANTDGTEMLAGGQEAEDQKYSIITTEQKPKKVVKENERVKEPETIEAEVIGIEDRRKETREVLDLDKITLQLTAYDTALKTTFVEDDLFEKIKDFIAESRSALLTEEKTNTVLDLDLQTKIKKIRTRLKALEKQALEKQRNKARSTTSTDRPKQVKDLKSLDQLGIKTPEESEQEDHEEEIFESYESVIDSLIENKNPQTRGIFLNPNNHRKMIRDLEKFIFESGSKEETIKIHTDKIKELLELLINKGSEDEDENGLLVNALRSDLGVISSIKIEIDEKAAQKEKRTKPAEPEQNDEDKNKDTKKESKKIEGEADDADKKNNDRTQNQNEKASGEIKGVFDLSDFLNKYNLQEISLLKRNPDLLNDFIDAIETHNKNTTGNASDKEKIASTKRLKKLRAIVQDYISNNTERRKEDTNKKSKGKVEYGDTDPDVAQKHFNAQLREKQRGRQNKDDENKKPEAKPAPIPEEEKEVRIFETRKDEEKDYPEILENKSFDQWLTNIEKQTLQREGTVENHVQSLGEWYKEYQDVLPYIKKLEEIYEKAKENRDETLKVLAAKEKMTSLIYEIHTQGETIKKEIENIYQNYKLSLEQKEKTLKLKKSKELMEKISNDRQSGSEKRELNSEQVRSILESRGKENIEENIQELVDFLQDIELNYSSYYANSSEQVDDDLMNVWKKYKARGGSTSQMTWWKKPFALMRASFSSTDNGYGIFREKIMKLRALNLVDRKTGNNTSKKENEKRIQDLIAFTKGQKELLMEHIQNPNSNKSETLNEEQKQILALFDSIYGTFVDGKYWSKEAKEKAEELLASQSHRDGLQNQEEPKTVFDILFTGDGELSVFETKAKYETALDAALKLEGQINALNKSGKNVQEWKRISTKFDEVTSTLESFGHSIEEDLRLKKIKLMIEDLSIKYMSREAYKDLSPHFETYERIFASERTLEEKTSIAKDLIDALKKLRDKKTNTDIQKGVVDDTIKRFELILKNLK